MKLFFISLCVALSALFSCQSKSVSFKTLSVDEFENLINKEDIQRLDVRTVAEFSEGHIPGSYNINVLNESSFTSIADSTLQKERPVAVYCRSGKRSTKAAMILTKYGYQVYELAGGFNAWKAANKKVEH